MTNQDAKTMAIKALEQEPSGDLISRQAVLDINESHHGQMPNHINHQIWQEIKDLPSVKQTGHWRPVYQGDEIIDYRCTECEFGNTFGKSTYRMNYCPNCGAKMV